MSSPSRRSFLQSTATAAGVAALSAASSARAAGANERVRVGLIGSGGRGKGVATGFDRLENVEVTYVCDPDAARAASMAASLKGEPKQTKDLRRVLDDKSIDVVIVATPDHWHAPAAILACEAGKHVYVEKPCSHNIREGRLLVEAARRNKRLVQHGTQSRSNNLIASGIQMLREGAIGDVLVAKAWNVQRRGEIGRVKPSDPPAGFDYDMWVGPAPMVPFQKNRHHYTWHWWHNFGTGDMGNDGVHELDIARWGLGVEKHPDYISAAGGKLSFKDDQEFPDTQYVCFDYAENEKTGPRRQLFFEMRLWSRYGIDGVDNGNAFYGTKGWMLMSKRGILKLYDERGREKPLPKSSVDKVAHDQNLIDAIRDDAPLHAEIEVGHLSATLCHLGNLATRVGRSLQFDPIKERIIDDEQANALISRKYRDHHWAIPKQV